MPLDNPMAYLKTDKAAASKGKQKMEGLLKQMMAAKLKAKLGKTEEAPEEALEASPEDAEPTSKENELPEEDMEVLRALYEKLK
jgi:uncharacterized membrane protein